MVDCITEVCHYEAGELNSVSCICSTPIFHNKTLDITEETSYFTADLVSNFCIA